MGDALLRRALSLFSVQQLILQTCAHEKQQLLQESVKDLLQHITTKDNDTCRITLEFLGSIILPIVLQAGKSVHDSIGTLLEVAASSTDLEVSATVRHTVASLIDRGLRLPISSLVPIMLGSERETFGVGSPSLHEGALPLLGRYIDAQLSVSDEGKTTKGMTTHLTTFIHAVRCDLEENNPFPTRFAAIAALSTLHHFWRRAWPKEKTTPLRDAHLALSIITYDALNDDDDEIRDAASLIATRIIAGPRLPAPTDGVPAQTKTVVPLAAARKLAVFLAQTYPASRVLCSEALHRLLTHESGREPSAPASALEHPQGFAGLLRGARGVESAGTLLFAREKQNLFLDPVREVGVWAGVLEVLRIDGAADRETVRTVEEWCVAGLNELGRLTREERDAAMGWASRGEVFLLGVRVVGAASVVLAWKRRGLVTVVDGVARKKRVGKYRSSEIKRLLRRTVDAWISADVHGLWVRETEEVLSMSVMEKLVDVRRMVEEVIGRTCVV